jgi:DtxR family Mn-dependent transcriptional regulator
LIKDLSQSLEDYIEAILIIGLKKKVVRIKEISDFLGVSTPSAVDAVSKLKIKGLVSHEKYGYLNLTKKGIETARIIYKKHEKVYEFLSQFLMLDEKTAEKDACKIEHYISKATLDRIIKLMEFTEKKSGEFSIWHKAFSEHAGIGSHPPAGN